MKHLHICVAAALAALISGCGGTATPLTPKTPSLGAAAASAGVPRYHAVLLSSLGGFLATGISDNQQGLVSGYSVLSGNATVHAALWYSSSTAASDLSTLGGANSAVEWPNHTPGQVTGISQISTIDPLGEQWSCSYPAGGGFLPYTSQECRGFVYANDTMESLGTLGGNNSFASGSNAGGQIVGWAETAVHDSTCVAPQVLQFEAVVWDRAGNAQALSPLNGDSDSAATAINNRGDVVGISGICQNAVGALSAEHMVVWHAGVPSQIPSLGGTGWNTPEMINGEGDVVGFSDLPGDQNASRLNAHAFLWTPGTGKTLDLGTLPGDAISFAYSINSREQIVGQSCGAGCTGSRAVLYQNGQAYDLNALLDADAGISLVYANDINDRGEITGLAVDSSGNLVGFRLIPDGTTSPQSVRTMAARSNTGLNYHLHIGPFGRPIITR